MRHQDAMIDKACWKVKCFTNKICFLLHVNVPKRGLQVLSSVPLPGCKIAETGCENCFSVTKPETNTALEVSGAVILLLKCLLKLYLYSIQN